MEKIIDQIRRIEWYHLKVYTATGSSGNRVSEPVDIGRQYRVRRPAYRAISASAEFLVFSAKHRIADRETQ